MRLIVAGGRHLRWCNHHADALALWLVARGVTVVLSGRCSGADALGEAAAIRAGIRVRACRAEWEEHGPSAGPLRNRHMAQQADAVLLLPGGKGTASMHREAVKCKLRIYDNRGSLVFSAGEERGPQEAKGRASQEE